MHYGEIKKHMVKCRVESVCFTDRETLQYVYARAVATRQHTYIHCKVSQAQPLTAVFVSKNEAICARIFSLGKNNS